MNKRIPSLEEYSVNESYQQVNMMEKGREFCSEVLKVGSKDNLFDKFIKKNNMNPDDLADLINAVVIRLQQL
jgi:hypothetical protein